jgi:predicted GNAT family N-acyltransferase
MMKTDLTPCIAATWSEAGDAISKLRTRVFVEEQGIEPTIVWDGADPDCRHYCLTDPDNAEALVAARIDPRGKLGRMAVHPAQRRQGLGLRLMAYILNHERQLGTARIVLHAQKDAIDFYKRANFLCYGDIFYEAGIAHQAMQLSLSPNV